MTREHVTKKLLAHGPLYIHEFIEITGWTAGQCYRILEFLRKRRDVKKANHGIWSLVQA